MNSFSERSFSLPSCHTVFISSVTLLNALYFREKVWAWILYGCLSLCMAVSRIALRMHWPLDTFCALLLTGILCPVLYACKAYILSLFVNPLAVLVGVNVYVIVLSLLYVFLHTMMTQENQPVAGLENQNVTTFKRTQIGTELRDNAHLLGLGLGAYIRWSIANGSAFGMYPTGINSMCWAASNNSGI
jgi:hypothetical protein